MFRTVSSKRRIIGIGVAAMMSVASVLFLLFVPGEEVAAAPRASCSTYKEWTYYSAPSHSVVVGSKTRFCTGSIYIEGQQSQYCNWFVTGCPFDDPICPDGLIETGSSNSC